ncbi:MAG TPA: hypothetical protein PK967_19940 [Candidatus Hydrogenedentes bacterium]|nr:MAG: hypothetical protein BWY59_00006 [Verrucomicrobia bacterium ADurb.Bin345]HOV72729.1 hypothetical protein [Candidatus Hydrogenedentota bacterium]HOV76229.1 hypothetical protein [Candidatus Hydrogenedentota bacterium]
MNTYRDPAEMTPDERLNEVAAILAAGLLRMRKGPVNKGVGACAKAEEMTGFPEGKEAFMVTPAQGNRE